MDKSTDSQVLSSTVIATIGRASLARAVESVLSQEVEGGSFEVIVVNDSGRPLPHERWQDSDRVRILQTHRRERSVARNTGSAVSRGLYLHFLDDDDWMLPGAFEALWAVARATNAAWVYGKTQFVDRNGKLLSESLINVNGNLLVQVMASGAWLPIQASLIKAGEFFKAGGFDPRFSVCEDKDIGRRMALRADFARTEVPVTCILIDRATSTSRYDRAFYYSQWSRDNVLSEKSSFARMLASASTRYWRGRMVRVYLEVVLWNLLKGRPFKMMRRLKAVCVTMFLSLPFLLAPDFIHGIFGSGDMLS